MLDSAEAYHTKTSYDRRDMSGHFLDWANQPNPFKDYSGFDTTLLPKDSEWPACNFSDLLTESRAPDPDIVIDENRLARILIMTHALTAKTRHGGADFFYRSIASAGALYPFELYVASFAVPGVADGLYHHDVARQGLTLLRPGSAVEDFSTAAGISDEPAPVLMFLLTSIFFRSSWKYRDRAFRYHLLDTGHMVENLAFALTAEHVHFKLRYDFDDERVNRLLGLDTNREACLAIAPVWGKGVRKQDDTRPTDLPEDLDRASRVAVKEVDYPAIRDAHRITSRAIGNISHDLDIPGNLGLSFQDEKSILQPEKWPEVVAYPEAVFKRRSMRNFVRTELPKDYLSALLATLCAKSLTGVDAAPIRDSSVCVGFLAGNVEGLEPGFYAVDRDKETIKLAKRGFLIDEMTHICLDQGWLANCALHFLFVSNLEVLEATCGPRGYRHAMLTAGRLGQRIYVGATSMRLGCCGIGAYYDNEAASLLGLNDASRLLYLVATGPVRKYTGT
jgi:SagB-type dehydrogenase family enzyme